ncbi:endonuclease YncB(thermonuclease family) [Sphingopyxis panaciterrae]|uniref:thermonuclease family protein n=1 Tax=Sphingopyxis panaciterrae TaxID=363841 RepID=UPI00141FCAE3|nr:thermonuclease family protein [Sphingopyxis panaciterrae]NIJ35480.1 endonuclease YncB(thermonuclease family) [Sphingopyxis panaciterrae]
MVRRPPYPYNRYPRVRHPYRRPGKTRFALWLFVAMAGGFAGTLVALQATQGPQARGAGASVLSGAVAVAAPDQFRARFGFCHGGGGQNCVVDGDTFRFAGETYRIADIDTPETHPPRCAEEAALGQAATERLRGLLNEGAFSLDAIDRDTDVHGRKLRIVTRDGTSVGERLVDEGLARRWVGRRSPWC